MSQQAVIVEYTKGERKGARFSVVSKAAAERFHPDAKILGYEADGAEFEPFEDTPEPPARPSDDDDAPKPRGRKGE